MIKRALLSVSDKDGLVELAKELHSLGIELISTGGTSAAIAAAGLPVKAVSDITGFPECLDGRVKTLHPRIHGGILAIRDNEEHMNKLTELEIETIDLIVINLYPFKATIQKPNVSFEECIENIDIGGPSMLRAAAKNHNDVTVLTDPADYERVITEIKTQGDTTPATRFYLARKVFEQTAAYDALIASYFLKQSPAEMSGLPEQLTVTYDKVSELRYGENPHQRATFYRESLPVAGSLPQAKQLSGKELSYNNIADTDAALALLKEFTEPTVVAIKHANPCGVGCADELLTAWRKAYEADQVSIFGGIVALNRPLTLEVAKEMMPVFLEVVVAPSFDNDALELLSSKKNLRLLELPDCAQPYQADSIMLKQVYGGLLIQDQDTTVLNSDEIGIPTNTKPDAALEADLIFAMKVVKHVKSNAIVLVKDRQTVGIGPGQPNRITSAQIAIKNAGEKARGSILGSDAFFPFADTVEAAAEAGITAIIQPGGSIRDQESIDACDKHGITMLMTGIRHFRH
ncbi:MAG: phosphoribosylaminoimidazolecarboxamide formyltransferase / cyclohydrolase [Clostridiales bacterium]|jgi:phosphoribosylaminoimidazolecarboxamide formyltransferase/IMP cyclohydrolase|nr:phosphoribosylaminoimidazolecarboxamide formyltransferase / cyclohydrolase [Clostridiales bacterium]